MNWENEDSVLSQSAINRPAGIGQLYDARTDKFSTRRLLAASYPPDLVVRVDYDHSEVSAVACDRLEDKFKFLNISPDLQVPILCDSVMISGADLYYKNDSDRVTVAGAVLNYVITCQQSLLGYQDLAPYIDRNSLSAPFTHVVVAIYWGGRCLLHIRRDDELDLETAAQEILETDLEIIKKYTETQERGLLNGLDVYEGTLFTDVFAELPDTLNDSIQFLANFPQQLLRFGNRNGTQLEYVMVPLSSFRSMFNDSLSRRTPYQAVDPDTITSITIFFQRISDARLATRILQDELKSNQNFINEFYIKKPEQIQRKINAIEESIKLELSAGCSRVKAGMESSQALLIRLETSKVKITQVESAIRSLFVVLDKLKLIESLESKNITYFRKGSSIESLFECDRTADVFVLITSEAFRVSDLKLHEDSIALLEKKSQIKNQSSVCIAVDLDLFPTCNLTLIRNYTDRTRILHIRKKEIISSDVLRRDFSKHCCNLAKRKGNSTKEKHEGSAVSKVTLKLTCPGRCGGKAEWTCVTCEKILQFGLDNNFHCECGGHPGNNYEFKCASPTHGEGYLPASASMKTELDLLEKSIKSEEVNILVFGKTGVGKSTWINSLVNYLQYDTLSDAERGGVKHVIPASFTVTYNMVEKQLVEIGDPDKSEILTIGQSATQEPKTYTFILNNKFYRIIDTPGLGDVEGIEKDKENMKLIVDHISTLKELHGICVLMKSNEARLDVIFKFCINELLTHLHRDAARNIIFCFTNSRSTFYSPGDTSAILEQHLKDGHLDKYVKMDKETIFCLDNEAFRFLCTLGYPNIPKGENERKSYAQSWEKSVAETKRLLNRVRNLPPHPVSDTVTLCTARERIITLMQPAADITRKLQYHMEEIEQLQEKLTQSGENISDLMSLLYIPRKETTIQELPAPRIVCTAQKCVTYNEFKSVEYKTHCHPKCELKLKSPDKFPNSEIRKCCIFSWFKKKCRHCHCSWKHHRYILYEEIVVSRNVIDKEIENKVNKQNCEAEDIEKHVMQLQRAKEEYEKEDRIIFNAACKFATFLKDNAIAPFNDGYRDYLRYQIEQEENRVNETDDGDNVLKRLKKREAEYNQQFLVFSNLTSSDQTHEKVTPRDIFRLEEELYHLPIYGNNIRQIVELSQRANKNAMDHNEQSLPVLVVSRNFQESPTTPEPLTTVQPRPEITNSKFEALKTFIGSLLPQPPASEIDSLSSSQQWV